MVHSVVMIDRQTESHEERASHVRVHFDLEVDEDGWPPVGTESMWALPSTEPGLVELANTPWFVRGLAIGDIIRVAADSAGLLRMTEHVSWSGSCTIRVIPYRSGPLAGDLQQVIDTFASLGANYEGLQQYGMVALSIPTHADLSAVKRLLRQGERDGWWAYDEGCIGDEWDEAG
ncbi:DUF4265 domain-containing protein [Nocardia sp. NPDC004711]